MENAQKAKKDDKIKAKQQKDELIDLYYARNRNEISKCEDTEKIFYIVEKGFLDSWRSFIRWVLKIWLLVTWFVKNKEKRKKRKKTKLSLGYLQVNFYYFYAWFRNFKHRAYTCVFVYLFTQIVGKVEWLVERYPLDGSIAFDLDKRSIGCFPLEGTTSSMNPPSNLIPISVRNISN